MDEWERMKRIVNGKKKEIVYDRDRESREKKRREIGTKRRKLESYIRIFPNPA